MRSVSGTAGLFSSLIASTSPISKAAAAEEAGESRSTRLAELAATKHKTGVNSNGTTGHTIQAAKASKTGLIA